MLLVLLWIRFQSLRCLLSNLISKHKKRHSSLWRLNVVSGGSLEIVQPVESLRDGASNHQNTVITHDHDLMFWVREQLRVALPEEGRQAAALMYLDPLYIAGVFIATKTFRPFPSSC